MLEQFRVATGHPELTEADYQRTYAKVVASLGAQDSSKVGALLGAKEHSRLRLIQLMAIERVPPEPKSKFAYRRYLLERQDCIDWLRGFLRHGCSCAS